MLLVTLINLFLLDVELLNYFRLPLLLACFLQQSYSNHLLTNLKFKGSSWRLARENLHVLNISEAVWLVRSNKTVTGSKCFAAHQSTAVERLVYEELQSILNIRLWWHRLEIFLQLKLVTGSCNVKNFFGLTERELNYFCRMETMTAIRWTQHQNFSKKAQTRFTSRWRRVLWVFKSSHRQAATSSLSPIQLLP